MKIVRYPVLPLALALAACGGNSGNAEGERKTAAGEVLGGSITDEMLPLDTATSQSPPMRETGAEPGASATGSTAASPEDEDEDEGEASEPAPDAAEAEPEPEPAAATEE